MHGTRSNDLAHRLQRVVLRLNRAFRAQNVGAGASNADALLLAEIRHAPGLGVSDLASAEGVARSVMSERVKRLEAAGLLHVSVSRADKRRVGLTITQKGRALLAAITAQRRAFIAERLAQLSGVERQALIEAIDALEHIVRPRMDEVLKDKVTRKREGTR